MRLIGSILLALLPGISTGAAAECGTSESRQLCGPHSPSSEPYVIEGGTQTDFAKSAHTLRGPNTRLSSGKYVLANDIVQDPSAPAFNCGRDVRIDLNGHTVYGYITCNADVNGFSLFNGNIVCDRPDNEQNSGCVNVIADNTVAQRPMRLHHLRVTNQRDAGKGTTFGIFLELGGVTKSDLKEGYFLQIRALDVSVRKCPQCSRSGAVFVVSNQGSTVEVSESIFTATEDSRACQGLNLYSSAGTRALVHNNLFLLPTNVTSESCRAVNFDANQMPQRDSAVAFENYIVNNNNRAFRCRSRKCRLMGNIIAESNVPTGAIHLYDQQEYYSEDYDGLVADDNTFTRMRGGYAFFLVSGRGGIIRETHQSGSSHGRLALIQSGTAVSAQVHSISCHDGLATYAFATRHNLEVSPKNGYGVRASIVGTKVGTNGANFDFSQENLLGIPTETSITLAVPQCPARSGTGGTLTTDADTSVILIDNDPFPDGDIDIHESVNSSVTAISCRSALPNPRGTDCTPISK